MKKVVPLEGFGGGGGTPLNFKIVAYATEEELITAQPKENTIGVITNVPITGYKLSATEPEDMIEGEVWICIGTNSNVAFDIAEDIKTYPLSIKQYINGVLVDKTAMSYQGGEWVNWRLYLYKAGDEYTDITGGWVQTVTDNHSEFVKSNSHMKLRVWYGYSVKAGTNNAIDLSGFNNLHFKIGSEGVDNTGSIEFFVASTKTGSYLSYVAIGNSNENDVITVDISNIQDSAFIGMYVFAPSSKFTHVSVKEVWMT